MAEIHIERKERSTWPWVLLGVLLLALLAWWLLSRNDAADFTTQDTTQLSDSDTTAGTGMAGGVMGATAGSVEDFVEWIRDNRARAEADTTHEFTAEGIRQLAGAIDAVGARGDTAAATIRANTDSMRVLADVLQREWQSTNHANHARVAFLQGAEALQRLREMRFPDAGTTVAQVREAAQRVQGSEPLLEQQQEVQLYFDRAAQTLQSMQGGGQGSPS